MKPTISTSPVEPSCTMAGARPSILSKSISIGRPLKFNGKQEPKSKKPAESKCRRAIHLMSALYLLLTGPRRHVRRVMMVMAMSDGKHDGFMLANGARACQSESVRG